MNGDHPINHITEAEKDRLDTNPNLSYMGLTKREYFAAKAMQGLIANTEWMEKYKGVSYLMPNYTVAETSVQIADALLAELSKPIANR